MWNANSIQIPSQFADDVLEGKRSPEALVALIAFMTAPFGPKEIVRRYNLNREAAVEAWKFLNGKTVSPSDFDQKVESPVKTPATSASTGNLLVTSLSEAFPSAVIHLNEKLLSEVNTAGLDAEMIDDIILCIKQIPNLSSPVGMFIHYLRNKSRDIIAEEAAAIRKRPKTQRDLLDDLLNTTNWQGDVPAPNEADIARRRALNDAAEARRVAERTSGLSAQSGAGMA